MTSVVETADRSCCNLKNKSARACKKFSSWLVSSSFFFLLSLLVTSFLKLNTNVDNKMNK